MLGAHPYLPLEDVENEMRLLNGIKPAQLENSWTSLTQSTFLKATGLETERTALSVCDERVRTFAFNMERRHSTTRPRVPRGSTIMQNYT